MMIYIIMMNRRHFLKTSCLVSGAGLWISELAAQNPTPPSQKGFIDNGAESAKPHLTCYPDTEGGRHQLHQLWIRKNNTVLTSYRAHPSQKYPFFYPVAGPVSGLSLTTETAQPWPHHRSLFFGLDRVNGGNYWQASLDAGQIISQGPSFKKGEDGAFLIDEQSVVINDKCLWQKKGADPIIEDERTFILKLIDDNRYVIDADITLKALTDVTVEKTNHGLYGVRCSHDISPIGGGRMVNAEGLESEAQTLGKPSRWIAFYGKRAGLKEEIVEGIAVLCPSKAPHPAFENCPWFTRDYGNISPTPMNWLKEPFKLPKDEVLKLRYRVVAFGGSPSDAKIDSLWEEFDQA
ncbi:MAG: PmoA family protein [Thermoguttaceae bacterium]